jgi:hypothetical protein
MFYCQDSSIFQSRLERMQQELNNENVSLLTAITGGIGNNSFDHNIGNWPKVPGIFFGYDINKKEIVLADRGQGLLKTLKRVKPELNNYQDAIRVAFTEIISGRSPEEMESAFKDVPEAIENTNKIANLCNLELELGEFKLPSFDVPDNKTAEDYLKELCYAGISNRYPNANEEKIKEVKDRLEYELSVINKTGFSGYFLINRLS